MNSQKPLSTESLGSAKNLALALSLSSAILATVPAQVEASIPKNNPAEDRNKTTMLIKSPQQLLGYYGDLNDTFLTLQKQERQARINNGAQMSQRTIRFEEVRDPNRMTANGLSLYYNDAALLEKSLGKSLFAIANVREVTSENINKVVQATFESASDTSWLRKTKNGVSSEYDNDGFQEYLAGVIQTRNNLLKRLADPVFRAYAVDRANAFIAKLESQGILGKKTLQAEFSGIMGLEDITKNAIHQKKHGRSLAVNAMTVIDHSNQVARAAYLADTQAVPGGKPGSKKSPILRYHISVPASASIGKVKPGVLIYTLAQRKNITTMLGDTGKFYGIAPEDVSVEFLKSFKESLSQIGTSK